MLFGVAVHAQTSSDDALKIARQIIANLVKGDYDSVVATFDEAMNKALTKESLKTAWESLIQQEGAYQGEITQSVQDSQSFKVVTLTLQFKNGALDARLPINSKGQLSGLQFVPNTTAGATPTPPTYADLTT